MKALIVAFVRGIGLDDVQFWLGLAALWFGLSRVYEPLAPIVCGLVLISFSVFAAVASTIRKG